MKTYFPPGHRQNERGFMIMTLLGILAFLMIFTTANIQTLDILHREIHAVQKAQIQRLKSSEPQSPPSEPVEQPLTTPSVDHD